MEKKQLKLREPPNSWFCNNCKFWIFDSKQSCNKCCHPKPFGKNRGNGGFFCVTCNQWSYQGTCH
jgi:hypothetical protein